MGDPRKRRKKYATPRHPWQRERLEREKSILYNYSLKNKKEIWRMNAILTKYHDIAKKLANDGSENGNKLKEQIMGKMYKLGFIKKNASIDDILSLGINDVMNRRLQSLVFNQKLARTMKQARQLIVHDHILIDDKRISSPSYIVPLADENKIIFSDKSPLKNEKHPERLVEEKKEVKLKEIKKEEVKVEKKPKKEKTEKKVKKTEEKE